MIAVLADENFTHAVLAGVGLAIRVDTVTAQAVGLASLPDRLVLEFAANQGRVVLSHDWRAMPALAWERVSEGWAMPGLIVVPKLMPIGDAVRHLVVVLGAGSPDDFKDQVIRLPL